MVSFFSLLFLVAATVCTASVPPIKSSTGPPPSTVTLVYPGALAVPPYSSSHSGYGGPLLGIYIDTSRAGGVKIILNVTIITPSGHEVPALLGSPQLAQSIAPGNSSCTIPNRVYNLQQQTPADEVPIQAAWLTRVLDDELGQYTLMWNLTYGTTARPDQPHLIGDHADFCADGLYSFQSFFMNTSFTVDNNASAFNALGPEERSDFFDHTTTLPSKPTGLAWTGNMTDEVPVSSARREMKTNFSLTCIVSVCWVTIIMLLF